MYAASRITVAINTEKIIPFNNAIHKVIGGNRQMRTSKAFPAGTFGEDGV